MLKKSVTEIESGSMAIVNLDITVLPDRRPLR